LLACPSIATLSARQPVDIWGLPERAALAEAGGIVDDVYNLDHVGFASVFSETPSDVLPRSLSAYHRAVVWMRDDDGAIAKALSRCGVKKVEVYPGLPPRDWLRHASSYYLECIGENEALDYGLTFEHREPSRDVIIHAGSGGDKNWPMNRFAMIADALTQQGRRVIWVKGPAEDDLQLPAGAVALDPLSLTELAGILASARLYIGNDSGISHLAAAAGCPTVAVFGPTDPGVWKPLGNQVRVVCGEPWPTVQEVLKTAQAM
jgi:hypothetical protein